MLERSLKHHATSAGNENKTLFVMSDACWNFKSKRYDSPMGTVTFIDVSNYKVVGVSYFINISKAANFDGPAKAMEGAGTDDICAKLKAQGFTVTHFLHDGDSSSWATIKQHFPECLELLCINHAAKNLGKFVYNQVDKEFRTNVQGWFKRVAVQSSKQPEDKAEAYFVDNPDREYSQKDALSKEKIIILSTKVAEFTKNAQKYIHGRNQSISESFNNLISVYAPKNVCTPHLYGPRVKLTVLMYNDGYEKTIRQLFQELVLPMPKAFSDYQEKGKAKKLEKKAKTYAKSSHTYKEVKKCGCKGGKKNPPCSTNACGCRGNKNRCNPSCAQTI